ncbi:MAG: hypothetical protein ABSC08_07885 [Bryobacteraceae bacterium]|jgi:hypothetical protein
MAKAREKLHHSCTAEKRKLEYLGPDPYATPNQIAKAAWRRFFEAMELKAPDVVAELRGTDRMEAAAWCLKHGLTFQGSASRHATIEAGLRQGVWLFWLDPGYVPNFDIVLADVVSHCEVPLSPAVVAVNWFAGETEEEAYVRTCGDVQRELRRTKDLLRQAGCVDTPQKDGDQHFVWLVHSQVLGFSNRKIAKEFHRGSVDSPGKVEGCGAVSDALAKLRKLMKLDPPRKPGRPSK